jgi:hypothetical protein
VRGQRHAPAAFYPRERPGIHCTGGWVGLRAGLDRCGKSRPPTGIRSPLWQVSPWNRNAHTFGKFYCIFTRKAVNVNDNILDLMYKLSESFCSLTHWCQWVLTQAYEQASHNCVQIWDHHSPIYILNLYICLQDYGTLSLVNGCRWLGGNTAYIFCLMMDAVASCGTFASTYHNGRSLSPEDIKMVFTYLPSWGRKNSCRLLWWKSFCLQRDEVQGRIGTWRGRRNRSMHRARGGACAMVPPKVQNTEICCGFFLNSVPLVTYAAGCDHHFVVMKPC